MRKKNEGKNGMQGDTYFFFTSKKKIQANK